LVIPGCLFANGGAGLDATGQQQKKKKKERIIGDRYEPKKDGKDNK